MPAIPPADIVSDSSVSLSSPPGVSTLSGLPPPEEVGGVIISSVSVDGGMTAASADEGLDETVGDPVIRINELTGVGALVVGTGSLVGLEKIGSATGCCVGESASITGSSIGCFVGKSVMGISVVGAVIGEREGDDVIGLNVGADEVGFAEGDWVGSLVVGDILGGFVACIKVRRSDRKCREHGLI
jgi:hypothetical protein